ncbi:WD repeat-containing protein 62-like isoform X2 [Rhinatrema bivittatum]|uniref:WD repeat-containing protein 62-like isoform X2 n=1 Tax=Rhinatrema bivittatum TaxID=194408 RepID=UPI001125B510|nr:WD repeat-containing protein 62-like isoform X2 [Rhinatrema bivittatum]
MAEYPEFISFAPTLASRKSSRHQRSQAVGGGGAASAAAPGRITLEKVLGITASSSGFTCDPNVGLIAYSAGCVIVLYCPKKNKQRHIFNTSRKPLSALSFSPDGSLIVSGESGHRPAVRVWDVRNSSQLSEMQGHKYGVACVAFSPNMRYIVSVGHQHDMTVNVWDWKKDSVVATNKVSSKVTAVSFSEDSSYFVTAGSRHVKFWYLETSKELQVTGTVPLVGRSGILGELHDNLFCGVACGKGRASGSTFCISLSGILCQFDKKRVLEKWIDLKVALSSSLCVSEDLIFCGCSDGTVRIFKTQNLHFLMNLPKPHHLGVDVAKGHDPSLLFTSKLDLDYPDVTAVAFDSSHQWLSCVYNDHSLYIWDIKDTRKVGKVWSALYHSSCIWNVEVYPEDKACLPPGSFLTCSSDNTIRLWNLDRRVIPAFCSNIYSHDLQKVLYVDDNIQCLKDPAGLPDHVENGTSRVMKSGVRVLRVSPDGQHLASGDRGGNLRIHDLQYLDELVKVEAHDAEVLCLEYSRPDTGQTLLASAGQDRLIHILNADKDYTLEQTLDDHSSSITAVKFAGRDDHVHMISCGIDKSIYFCTGEKVLDGVRFSRNHHVVEKTTFYDMDIDVSQMSVAVACQDRNVRLYNVVSGKQERLFKGSPGEDGSLLKVHLDPSGTFLATSCSDKNVAMYDFDSGKHIVTIFGHSEIVTSMKFSYDCRHLITVSGDSCVFVWRLGSEMRSCMRQKLERMNGIEQRKTERGAAEIRRETYITVPFVSKLSDDQAKNEREEESLQTPLKPNFETDPTLLLTNGRLPLWARRLVGDGTDIHDGVVPSSRKEYRPQGRWAEHADEQAIKTVLNAKYQTCCDTPSPGNTPSPSMEHTSGKRQEDFQQIKRIINTTNFESLLLEMESMVQGCPKNRVSDQPSSTSAGEMSTDQDSESTDMSKCILYPTQSNESLLEADGEYDVKEATHVDDEDSSSVCCEACSDSQLSKRNQQEADVDSLGSVGFSQMEIVDLEENSYQDGPLPQTEQENFLKQHFETLVDAVTEEKFDGSLKDMQPSQDSERDFLRNPRLSISARFLSCFQKNGRFENTSFPKVQKFPRQMEALGRTKEDHKVPSDAKRSINTLDVTEKRNSNGCGISVTEIAGSSVTVKHPPRVQNMHETEKGVRQPSLQHPGTYKDLAVGRVSKSKSYMSATASSKAKMSRSISMGENINTNSADSIKPEDLTKPLSNIDLPSLGQKVANTLNPDCMENLCPKQPEQTATLCGNHEVRAKLMLNVCSTSPNRLLMPPPLTSGIHVTLDKQKEKQVNQTPKTYLSVVTPTEMKSLGRDEHSGLMGLVDNERETQSLYSLKKRHVDYEEVTFNSQDSTQDRTIALDLNQIKLLPTCVKDVLPNNSTRDDQASSDFPQAGPDFPNNNGAADRISKREIDGAVTVAKCEQVVWELKDVLQRALQLYSKIAFSSESLKEQVQMKSILGSAFLSIKAELDPVAVENGSDSAQTAGSAVEHRLFQMKPCQENCTVALLEHYSELLLKIMQRKINGN